MDEIVCLLFSRYLGSFNAKLAPCPRGTSQLFPARCPGKLAVPSKAAVKVHLGMTPAFNELRAMFDRSNVKIILKIKSMSFCRFINLTKLTLIII